MFLSPFSFIVGVDEKNVPALAKNLTPFDRQCSVTLMTELSPLISKF
jgi:hypothetical protein